MKDFLLSISRNNDLFRHVNKSFFNYERFYLANKLLSNIRCKNWDVIITSWYVQLLDKIEHKGSVDVRKGAENLLQVCLRSNIDLNWIN